MTELQERWREQLRTIQPRSDAAAWPIIDLLPAHPVITIRTAIAATGRTRPAIVNALDQLTVSGVLLPLAESPRNRTWEATGLLELIVGLEEGTWVPKRRKDRPKAPNTATVVTQVRSVALPS